MGIIDRIRSEYLYLRGALRVLKPVTRIAGDTGYTIVDRLEDWQRQYGNHTALISVPETYTFTELNERANQYARWVLDTGMKKGDTVAFAMHNRAEYMAVWMGIARAGGVTACLNTNLTDRALAHCINIVGAKHVIVEDRLWGAFTTAMPLLDGQPVIWCHGAERDGAKRLDAVVDEKARDNIRASDRPKLTTSDECLYIYTSGTTGLPKAAKINHFRAQSIMAGFNAAAQMTSSDRIYVCLPMYHTTGGILAPGSTLWSGGSVVLSEKFSARNFWDEVTDNKCTAFQYIGELCRYLLNTPVHPKENAHQIRIVSGNGLRPDIWEEFKNRFQIPKILEWYAATEGNAVYFNFDEKVGAVGRVPKWAEKRFVTEVVEFDLDNEQPVRGADGFCIKCPPNKPGEVISQIIIDPKRPSQRFDGYADKEATNKKILKDAFEKGDAWFRTGDLMRKDELGYMYFVDRIGDTFRWKGENVATSEVSEAVTSYPGVKEANVYGVAIDGMDGRAGMAALVTDENFKIEGFGEYLKKALPAYAHPVFLRMTPAMEVTGTFKQRKVDLVQEGFDPDKVEDPLWFNMPGSGEFKPIDKALFDEINAGQYRF